MSISRIVSWGYGFKVPRSVWEEHYPDIDDPEYLFIKDKPQLQVVLSGDQTSDVLDTYVMIKETVFDDDVQYVGAVDHAIKLDEIAAHRAEWDAVLHAAQEELHHYETPDFFVIICVM